MEGKKASVTKKFTQKRFPKISQTITSHLLTTAEPDEYVVYSKADVTAFRMALAHVPYVTEPTEKRACDILWVLPNQLEGVTCQVVSADVTFTNMSPETIFVRLQRPLAYASDVSSLAMWEAVPANTPVFSLRPHSSRVLKLGVAAPRDLVARRVYCKERVCMHLLSYKTCREPVSDTGEPLTYINNVDALEVQVCVRYTAHEGTIGRRKQFCQVVHADDKYLDLVSQMPATPIAIGDLGALDQAISLCVVSKNSDCHFMEFVGFDMTSVDYRPTGLDLDTIYSLPAGYVPEGKGSAIAVMLYNYNEIAAAIKGRWILGVLESKKDGSKYKIKFELVATSDSNSACFPATMTLTPLLKKSAALKGYDRNVELLLARSRITLPSGRVYKVHSLGTYGGYTAFHSTGTAALLDSIVMVVKILKAGITFAGAVAALFQANLENQHGDLSTQGSVPKDERWQIVAQSHC